jgi:hypothetical protein
VVAADTVREGLENATMECLRITAFLPLPEYLKVPNHEFPRPTDTGFYALSKAAYGACVARQQNPDA